MCVYIYIYICIYICAEDRTPEINTSEIIVGSQWRFPMDVQYNCPTEFHCSVVFPKGLSLFWWISTGMFKWMFSDMFQ